MPGDSIRNPTSSPISVGGRQKPNLLEFGLPVKNLTIPLKGARKKTHRNYQFCCCFLFSRHFFDPPTSKMENSERKKNNERLWRLGSFSGSKTYFSAFFFSRRDGVSEKLTGVFPRNSKKTQDFLEAAG